MNCLKEKTYLIQKEKNSFISQKDFMSKITVYEKPTCTTCRKVAKLLIENGADFEKVNYYIKPFTKTKLQSLLKKINMKPSELLRKNELIFKDLRFKEKNYTDKQILDLMVKYPDLVQRPIVEKGNKAILARPAERILELF